MILIVMAIEQIVTRSINGERHALNLKQDVAKQIR
jgi:hypothetical protein